VLLRQIEYFRGILFLTTNLLSNIDDAFMSRIHIHLCYPSLDCKSRLQIWEKNLSRLRLTLASSPSRDDLTSSVTGTAGPEPRVCVSEDDLVDVAQWGLNGRHIRNVVKNTHLWCLYNGFDITHARLVASIPVTAPFAEKSSNEEDPPRAPTKRRRIDM